MKFDDMQKNALEQKKIETAWKANSPLLQEAFQRYGVSVPEGLEEAIKALGKRLDKVIPVTFEEFNSRWPDEIVSNDSSAMKIVDVATKSHFPVLYLYTPELQNKLREVAEQHRRNANCSKICEQLKTYSSVEASDELKKFIMESLPLELPKKFYFDGSFERVKRLAAQSNVKSYADEASKNIGVISTRNDEEVLTLFVDGIDYVASFAKFMVKKLGIDEAVAMKISSALPHDVYYGIRGYVENDLEKHATLMARLLQVSEGDLVNDLYQGEVNVVTGALSKKLALNLDDELPSAILIDTKVNVYLPAKK